MNTNGNNYHNTAHEQVRHIKCPECGIELPAGALFCGNCGHKLPATVSGNDSYNASANKSMWIILIVVSVLLLIGIIVFTSRFMLLRKNNQHTPSNVNLSVASVVDIDSTPFDSPADTTGIYNYENEDDEYVYVTEIPAVTSDTLIGSAVSAAPTEPEAESSSVPSTVSTTVVSTKYLYNCDYGLCLWTDTSCSDYYCIVLVGEAVGFIEDSSGTNYAKVSYGNYIGYLNRNYLSDSKSVIDTTVKYDMYCTTNNVNFRSGPSTNYSSVYTLSLNDSVGYIRDMVDFLTLQWLSIMA